MTPSEAVARYLEAERARGMSERTVEVAEHRLRNWLRYAEGKGLGDIAAVATEDIREYLAETLAKGDTRAKSGNPVLYMRTFARVVRRLFAWAAKAGLLLVDPAEDIRTPKVRARLPRNILTIEEMKMLLEAPDTSTPVGVRNRAIIELLYSSGLRCGEALRLELQDVDMRERRVFIREGKGGKDRVVPAGVEAVKWLTRYVEESRPLLERDAAELALFLGEHGKPLTTYGVAMMLRECRERAGIAKWISPHCLRHTCATHLVQSGADIRYVQELLGHESAATTEIYTRVAPKDLEDAHREHHPKGKKKPSTP